MLHLHSVSVNNLSVGVVVVVLGCVAQVCCCRVPRMVGLSVFMVGIFYYQTAYFDDILPIFLSQQILNDYQPEEPIIV